MERKNLGKKILGAGAVFGLGLLLVVGTGCTPPTPPTNACSGDPCTDENPCTIDTCAVDRTAEEGYTCTFTPVECEGDLVCDPTTGECVEAPAECFLDADCDDDNVCTDDTCNAEGVCEYANNTEACDDGDACTEDDVCADGACAGTAVVCDAGFECDAGDCVEIPGWCTSNGDCAEGEVCEANACVPEPVAECTSNGDCDEGWECVAGECVELELIPCTTDDDCDDGLYCNGVEFCNTAGFCEDGDLPCDPDTETCEEGDSAAVCLDIEGPSQNFTLGPDDLTGGGGADSFLAAIEVTGLGVQANTLQSGDAAEGLAGDDTLDAYLVNGGANLTVAATLGGIEELNFTDFSTTFITVIDGSSITGAETINLLSSLNNTADAFSVNNLPNVVDIGITNSSEDFELVYSSTATADAADAMTLTLSNSSDGTYADRSEIRISAGAANGIETLTVHSTGSANRLNQLTQTPNAGTAATSLATLNVTGDQNLSIGTVWNAATFAAGITAGGLDNSILTINAATFTGGLAGSEGLIAGNGAVAFTGGDGDDTVMYCNVTAGPTYVSTYTTADVIDGGGGTDTLGLVSADAAPAANQTNVSNIEGLRIINSLASSPTLSRWGAGVVNVTLDDGGAGGTITYPAGTENTLTLGAFGITDASGGAVSASVGSAAVDGDALLMTVDDCDQTGAVTVTGAETVNLVSNVNLNGGAASGGVNAFTTFVLTTSAFIETLNISGNEDVTFAGAVTADAIDASAFTQALTMSAATLPAGASQQVQGGSGNDTLYGSTGGNGMIGNAGNDTILALAGDDVINGGDGSDTITGGPGADVITCGTGNDVLTITTETDSLNTSMDVVQDFTSGQDDFDVDTVPATVGSCTAGVNLNTASVASTGATTGTLATDITTVQVAALANCWDQAGDAHLITVTGTSIGGVDAVYLVIEDGTAATAYNAAADAVILMGGTSSTTLVVGDFQ